MPPCPSATLGAQGIPTRASAGSLPPRKAFGQGATSPTNNQFLFMIPVLFTEKNSVYNSLPGVDAWPKNRNAFNYSGSHALIAHPPCRLFSRLRAFSTAPASEKNCAYFALEYVRQNGSILEHPHSSTLWKEMNLPTGQEVDEFGGFTLSVNLSWFGYPATKKTLLYIVGLHPGQLPPYSLNFDAVKFSVSSSKKRSVLQEIPKAQRSSTPLLLANYLVQLATLIESKKNTNSFIHSKFLNHEN